MTVPRIIRHDEGGLCSLILNRPDKLNALDSQAFEELDAHLADLEQQTETTGCVLLRGQGRGFCAGADLGAMGVRSDGSAIDPRYKPRVIERLSNLPQPVIAAVHGVCLTGGLELVLACDFIVADTSARFADTHGKWGLVAAWGLMQRLPRRIGAASARRMMMTGRHVAANEAHALGLVDILAREGELEATAVGLAREIMDSSWHTNFAVKRTLRETEGMSLSSALAHDGFRYPGDALDHNERVARFAKK
jgi:enoyl-CoA hydratase/carnithine racemase